MAHISRRAFPQWGAVNFELLEGWSNYHGVDLTFTKRFSRHWQVTATTTRSWFRDADPCRDQWYMGADGIVARRPIGFPLARDLTCEYTFAGSTNGGGFAQGGDQRQRAILNGIWDIGRGVQLSGIYFYGSGERFRTVSGSDLRDEAGGSPVVFQRYRRDGTIIPRAPLVGLPIHRVDMRLQKQLTISERVKVFGIFEVFNLFNHANYGTYTTNESNANYGKPSFSDNLAYQPRMLQLGFRTTF